MRLRLAALVAAAVAASLLAVPAAAVEWVEERAYVPTPHGEMFVDFVRPRTGKAPVLLSVTPDRYLHGDTEADENRTDFYRERYSRQGYARAYADLLGTGLSGGCWDYGGRASAEAAAALVEWLGTRPWSNGRVGMIGIWAQVEVATLAPKHLAAIVPQETVSSWYDYNYDHAVSHATSDADSPEDAEYPVSFAPELFHAQGALPDPDPARLSAAGALQAVRESPAGCDAVEHEVRAHVVRPEYDAFWRERDWALRADRVRAAVLFQHGWRDTATKPVQFTRFWQNLRNAADKRALVGQWDFADIFAANVPDSVVFPVDPLTYLDLFLARHLKGVRDPRLDRIPKVLTEGSDRRFRTTLPLDARRTSFPLATPMAGGTGTFVNSGSETSKTFKGDVAAQRGFAAYAVPVTKGTRLAGAGEVTLRLTSSLPRGQVAVTLLDLPPEGTAATVVTLGLLDLRFRDSMATPKDVPVGTPFTARVALRPQDYVLEKGHRLVVAVAGSDVVWGVPDPLAGQRITVLPGSAVRLPLVGAGGTV